MSLPTRILDSASQLTRCSVLGREQSQDLTSLTEGRKQSLARPRTSIHDESGSSSLKSTTKQSAPAGTFRTKIDLNATEHELDLFLDDRKPDLEGHPADLTPVTSAATRKLCDEIHKQYDPSVISSFELRTTGYNRGQASWHQDVIDLGIIPEDLLRDQALINSILTKPKLHDERCGCDDPSHYKSLLLKIFHLALNHPQWYRSAGSNSRSKNHLVPRVSSGSSPHLPTKRTLLLQELPITVDTSISEVDVNMAWLHDPYCACQEMKHRAQLRKQWRESIKALWWADHCEKNLDYYLLEHMGVARRQGYFGQDMLGLSNLEEVGRSDNQRQEVARANMMKHHISRIDYQDIPEEGRSTDEDFASALFPEYASLPFKSRTVPLDVLVSRYPVSYTHLTLPTKRIV